MHSIDPLNRVKRRKREIEQKMSPKVKQYLFKVEVLFNINLTAGKKIHNSRPHNRLFQ